MITDVLLADLAPDTRRRSAIDAVLSSLPLSLRPSTSKGPGAVVIDGSHGWPLRLTDAVRAGARAAVVVDPVASTVLPDVDVPVAIDRAHSSRPGISRAEPAIRTVEPHALLELRSLVDPDQCLAEILLEQFTLIRVATRSRVREARCVSRTAQGFTVRGHLQNGRALWCTAERTSAVPPRSTVRLVGNTTSVSISVPDSRTARPVETVVVDDDGARLLPTHWETSHRATWRRLHAALVEGNPLPDLRHHVEDSMVLAEFLSEF